MSRIHYDFYHRARRWRNRFCLWRREGELVRCTKRCEDNCTHCRSRGHAMEPACYVTVPFRLWCWSSMRGSLST